jgi:hypothetical protein
MLITNEEVISIAFVSAVEAVNIKDSVIMNAQLTYIKPALTLPLYIVVENDPESYPELITQYLKPCLSYYVKYLAYSTLFIEKSGSIGLIDPIYSVTNFTEIRQASIQDSLSIAQNFEKAMVDYIILQSYPEYQPPTPPVETGRLKCGFYI